MKNNIISINQYKNTLKAIKKKAKNIYKADNLLINISYLALEIEELANKELINLIGHSKSPILTTKQANLDIKALKDCYKQIKHLSKGHFYMDKYNSWKEAYEDIVSLCPNNLPKYLIVSNYLFKKIEPKKGLKLA